MWIDGVCRARGGVPKRFSRFEHGGLAQQFTRDWADAQETRVLSWPIADDLQARCDNIGNDTCTREGESCGGSLGSGTAREM